MHSLGRTSGKSFPFSPLTLVPCVSACALSNAHAFTVFSAIFPFAWRNLTSARPSEWKKAKSKDDQLVHLHSSVWPNWSVWTSRSIHRGQSIHHPRWIYRDDLGRCTEIASHHASNWVKTKALDREETLFFFIKVHLNRQSDRSTEIGTSVDRPFGPDWTHEKMKFFILY